MPLECSWVLLECSWVLLEAWSLLGKAELDGAGRREHYGTKP